MVTIDPINKRFVVTQGTQEVNVQKDIYMYWKKWVLDDPSNLRYQPAFRTTGGEIISRISNQVTPRYFFLINNWKVQVQNSRVSFRMNLYSDDTNNTNTPFDILNSEIQNNCSDVGIVTSDSSVQNSSGENILDAKIAEHLQNGTFGELLQKTFLAAAEK